VKPEQRDVRVPHFPSTPTGRWLKLLSGLVMLVLGAVMMLRPQWLM
jgi:uncharacterized membrane protein HdeD (DUF308 family)